MLTLKEPIQLKAHSPLNPSFEGFGERITHNYGLLTVSIEPEDLLHIVTAPAELYLAEGGMTNLFTNTEVRNEQEWKLEVMNNVINRILLSDTNAFTYQDMVYVSSVLHKLGIHNEQKFMKQVEELRTQSDNTTELINLYWNHTEELRRIIGTVKESKEKEEASAEEEQKTSTKERYYLQESIYDRLETAAIYQLLKNFYQYQAVSEKQITQAEMRIAEQEKVSRQMLLQKLKNVTMQENKVLLYHAINTYEMGEILPNKPITERLVIEEIASAVLLNLVDNVYALRAEKRSKEDNQWYSVENAMFLSAENTINRYESYHREAKAVGEETKHYITQNREHTKEEILLLHNFVENTIPLYYGFKSSQKTQEEQENFVQETENIIRQTQTQFYDNRTIQDTSMYQQSNENTNLYEKYHLENRQFESVEEQVAYYEQQNQIIREQLLKMEEERPRVTTTKVDKQKARRDSLRALEDPEALIQEYLTENTRIEQETRQIQNQYEKLMSKETKAILERLERYQESPQDLVQAGIITNNPESMLQAETQLKGQAILEYPLEEDNDGMRMDSGENTKNFLTQIKNDIYQNLGKQNSEIEIDEKERRKRLEEGIEGGSEEVYKLLQAAGSQLIYHEVTAPVETDMTQIREVINGVEKVLHFYRTDIREERLAEAKIVHKQLDNSLDEETVQEMIRLNTKKQKTEMTETHIEQGIVKETVTNNTTQNTVKQTTETIAELVQKGLQREMAVISEQVYRKLEQRLKNEQSRRGY